MGLLDALLYNSEGYGGQGGGLLDFLRSSNMQQQNYQPSQGFPATNNQPSPPSAFTPSGRQFDSATFDPQTYAPNQAQPIAVGNYQMPRIGDAPQFVPQPGAPQVAQTPQAAPPSTDISAQSRQPQPPPDEQSLPPALGGGGYLDRVINGGGLVRSLFPSAQQQNLSAQYKAVQQTLVDGGMSPREAQSKAMLAVMNPEAGKTILQEALTSKEKYGVTSDNPIEGKRYGFINERDQTINGKPIGQGGGEGGQGPGMLAPGVKFDSSKSGEDYLNQFSPEVKAAVKSYINGDVMPTGNPRLQGISNMAKTIAQKYGQDTGVPVSDTLYAEKRKYRTELGTNSANSAGGQAKAFNQGIFHLTELADKLEKLDNSNGLGIPVIAQGVNAVRQGFSNEQSAISDEAKSIGQTVAGEVGKLFSGQAGGGVHERALTRERFDTIKSKPQLAAALRATLVTMDGGLKALEQRRDSILGPNSGVDLVGEETRKNIVKVQAAIDRLEGRNATVGGGIPSGWSVKVR